MHPSGTYGRGGDDERSEMARRGRRTHPVVERQRRLLIEVVVLAVLTCVAVVLVILALQS